MNRNSLLKDTFCELASKFHGISWLLVILDKARIFLTRILSLVRMRL